MLRSIIRFAPRCIGIFGAILLIVASALLGAWFGFQVGSEHHVAIAVLFAAAALGGELLKPFAVAGVFEAIRERSFTRAAACLMLAAMCVVYSVAAELTLAAGSRGDMAAGRAHAATEHRALRERRARAEAELAGLSSARTAAEIGPSIAKALAAAGIKDCDRAPETVAGRRACAEVRTLEVEAARSERRRELEQTIADASASLSADRVHVKDADPLAAVLSAYASEAGRPIAPDRISPWLALIPVLFLEIGSAFGLVVARSIPISPETPATGGRDPEPIRAVSRPSGPQPLALGQRAARVLAYLAAHGPLAGGQRSMARALGLSKSTLNISLRELERAGHVVLDTSPTGTRVMLA